MLPSRVVKKVQPVLGGFSREDYATERLWATAPDGTKVRQTRFLLFSVCINHDMHTISNRPCVRGKNEAETQAGDNKSDACCSNTCRVAVVSWGDISPCCFPYL